MFITEIDTMQNLSSKTVNAIENTAINIAAQNDGNLYTIQLMPFFSLSLKHLDQCLLSMVDNSSILKLEKDGINYYKFKNINSSELPNMSPKVREISVEQDNTNTKLEHQIIFATSQMSGHISPAAVAANTDFTISEVKEKMEDMNLSGYITEKLNEDEGSIYYIVPELKYPERNFKVIMNALYPQGSQESFDVKMAVFMKYLFSCLALLVALFFAKVNFRLLIILFLFSMPFSAFLTYLKCKAIKG